MASSMQSGIIQISKVFGAIILCTVQVLFFYQVMPFGELYIGLLSLVIDLTVYCWLVSGAYKALNQPARRRAGVKTPARPKRARRSGAVSKQSR